MLRGAVGIAAVVGILLLAGCAPDVPSSHPSPRKTIVAPVPSPTPTTPPALSDLVLSTNGLGPLTIGQPVPETPENSAVVLWNPTKCGTTGAWLANYKGETDEYGNADSAPFYFPVEKKTDAVNDLVVISPHVTTSKSVGVGSTPAQLRAAYPSLNAAVAGPVTDLYVLHGADGDLVFEVGRGDSWLPAQDGTVVLIQLHTPRGTPTSVADNDASGICIPD